MFLDAFKRKSIKRSLERVLDSPPEQEGSGRIRSIGFLVDARQFNDIDRLWEMARKIKGDDRYCKVCCYVQDIPEMMQMRAISFDDDVIGWKGQLKDTELEEFTAEPFDLLVNFFTQEDLSLIYIAGTSRAKFKAGFPLQTYPLNDLVIDTPLQKLETFETELIKYLKILKRIA
ncbi:DUF6913 domain-containing protein [Croceiramulus getboli]|nr:hypothetical protein P8624_14250 [Flavobacteriaceae bacterium YJPT1-3]